MAWWKRQTITPIGEKQLTINSGTIDIESIEYLDKEPEGGFALEGDEEEVSNYIIIKGTDTKTGKLIHIRGSMITK